MTQPAAVQASPDGAAWETAQDPAGCRSCHLGDELPPNSDALRIEGLPDRLEPGTAYPLTIRLIDDALKNAGFLLTITAATDPGELSTSDGLTEAMGSQARSTWKGSLPTRPGEASWTVVWTTPTTLDAPLTLDLWGNAGNDDLSPLGDSLHHRAWQLHNPQ